MGVADDPSVAQLIELARREDLGPGDITTQLLDQPQAQATFRLVAKQPGVFAGAEIVAAILRAYDPSIRWTLTSGVADGSNFAGPGSHLADFAGPPASLLAAERVLLNFLQRLSGIATLTRRFVAAVAGTHAEIYDTRKTVPGWRSLDKYAVRCGGGKNHRFGLHDAVLLKDNHLAGVESRRLAGTVFEMLNRLGDRRAGLSFVAVEAQNVEQAKELMKVVGVDVILLDNFDLPGIREAVEIRDSYGLAGKVALEVSGGVRLDTVQAIAETGVERISVGAITHSAPALDLSLERA